MDLFLSQFEFINELYESDMYRHTGKVLSLDQTFKKHVGITCSDDNKFVYQFENVFLGLNETEMF